MAECRILAKEAARDRERKHSENTKCILPLPGLSPHPPAWLLLSSGLKGDPLVLQGAENPYSLGQVVLPRQDFSPWFPPTVALSLTSTPLSLQEAGGSRSDQGFLWSKKDLPSTLGGVCTATTLREARGATFLKTGVI